ncbi:hypothetical protein JW962_00005 [Candidatus Dojkabacteria bacterium]|nr:hypothetical protein [Candidatus Dojkabacteria bacterium]
MPKVDFSQFLMRAEPTETSPSSPDSPRRPSSGQIIKFVTDQLRDPKNRPNNVLLALPPEQSVGPTVATINREQNIIEQQEYALSSYFGMSTAFPTVENSLVWKSQESYSLVMGILWQMFDQNEPQVDDGFIYPLRWKCTSDNPNLELREVQAAILKTMHTLYNASPPENNQTSIEMIGLPPRAA